MNCLLKKHLYYFLILGTLCAHAQSWPTVRYTPREGLPGMQCMSIFRDSRGVAWVATKSGLSRFNGERFENFFVKDGLFTDYVHVVGEDSKGYLWFCNDFRGLLRFDGQVFKKYRLPVAESFAATIGQNDEIIAVCHSTHKPYHVVGDTILPLRWRNVPPRFYTHNGGLFYHKTSQSYLCRIGDSVFVYKNQQLRFLAVGYTYSKFAHGDIHLNTYDNRPLGAVNHARWDGQTFQYFLTTKNNGQPEVRHTLPYDFVFTHANRTYLLHRNSRNYEVISDYYVNAVEYGGTPDQPTAIRYLATEKGLLGLVKNGFKNFTEAQVPYAWSVAEDRHGHYHFANFGHSLQKFDGQTLSTIKDPTVLASQYWYYNALRDQRGNLWLPRGKGLLRYDGAHWQAINLSTGPDSLAFCMAEHKTQNTLVVGSTKGLYFVENRPPFRSRYQTGPEPIYQNNPMSVAIAPDGAYWFSGYGVARYDSLKHRTVFYNRDNDKLPTGGVVCLFFDKAGTLWAGSVRKGLFRYNPQKDNFERVFSDWLDGMVPFVAQFDDTHLLVADFNNLYVVPLLNPKEKVRCFNHNNGFMGVEPGQLGSYRDSKGKIWITSGTVLSVLDPAQLDLRPRTLQARITHVSQADTLPLRLPFVGKTQTVALPFGQNSVSFTVEAVGEDKPFASQYSYRVAGFADKWSDWQTQNVVALTNLPNGTFMLEVKARRGLLAAETAVMALPFKISVWFWQSPNFYKYASLLGLLLVAGMAYFWQRDRKKQKHIVTQQKNLEDRERDVRFLQIQTIQAQMNPHFTFNVLGTIQHLIANNDTEKANENLLKLSNLMRSYLESSMLNDEKNGSLYASEIPLAREIELLKMYVEFEQLQYEDQFTYQLTVDGKLNTENYRIPPLIIQPFVENAIKHGLLYKKTAGNLEIRFVAIDAETLLCTIEDDGVGRAAAREVQANSLRKYKSRGTGLVEKRKTLLNEMGYDIDIQTDDRLEGGTVVTIKIGYAA